MFLFLSNQLEPLDGPLAPLIAETASFFVQFFLRSDA